MAALPHPEKYAGKEARFGSVTDSYQPCEKACGRSRALVEQPQDSGIRIRIAAKSDQAPRGLDLIRAFPQARISWSINTLDEGLRREMDRCNLVWPENLNLRGNIRRAF